MSSAVQDLNVSANMAPISDPLPFPLPSTIDPFVQGLVDLVGGMDNLEMAVQSAANKGIAQMEEWGITDAKSFLEYATGLLTWIPSETVSGKEIYYVITLFYFILDQPPIDSQQNPIHPTSVDKALTPVTQWCVTLANKVGEWMDTPASLTPDSLASFAKSPHYNFDEAQVPPGGFKTFNQLFCRRLKPGSRPISEPDNDSVITWPADSCFDGSWPIGSDNLVSIKGIDWPISALLASSNYANAFEGGTWMHAFLNTTDYHRQHTPVSGQILEAKVIQGQAYCEVDVVEGPDGRGLLKPHRSWKPKQCELKNNSDQKTDTGDDVLGSLDAPDNAGYQFLQTRGCVIIDNPTVGLVAVLPVGMAQVSSVKLSVQDIYGTGAESLPSQVNKGDEIACFLFGGSDIVLVFQEKANVDLSQVTMGQHYKVGEVLATANGASNS